ncbi:hypothetical protein GobsT_43770 [Gemmata obscuriglobus]|nr:hypothetical protein GobsT_43770 [Gemmata obscuriglobus]VTS08839.1 unnamed protein product [Gemmata obscuriglobus UQM 2246]
MRWLGCVALGFAAAVAGGFAFMQVGEIVFAFTDTFAPGFFPGCYPGLIRYSSPEFDAPRKHAWADMVGGSALCGAACIGSVTVLIRGLRLGGAVSVLRAYLIVCLSGLAGACAGGGGGYLLGAAAPGYSRRAFSAGGDVVQPSARGHRFGRVTGAARGAGGRSGGRRGRGVAPGADSGTHGSPKARRTRRCT